MTDIISASEEIAHIRKEIERHNHLYYVEAKPELSDYDFDKLLEKLIYCPLFLGAAIGSPR